jgi:predicted dehydrogenase
VKIALVGFGFWGKVWHRTILEHSAVDLACVFSPSHKDVALFTSEFERVIAADIKAVIVACSTPAHYEVVKSCLNAGKHVLCEKPLALTLAHADELARLAQSRGLALHTNFSYLESPTIQAIKSELLSLGEIYCAESWIDGLGNFYPNEDAYSVHSPHVLALTFSLFPDLQFEIDTLDLVFSRQATVDVGVIRMRCGGFTALHHTSLRGISRVRRITLYGSNGTAEYDATNEHQFALRKHQESAFKIVEGETSRLKFDESLNIARSLDRFIRIIEGQESSNIDIALKVAQALESIQAQVRRPVNVA